MGWLDVIEKFELENYTAEARHHMLKVIEQALNDDVVIVAYEDYKDATKQH